MNVNKLLVKADVLFSAANRCQLCGEYAMATMYKKKGLELRKLAHRIGQRAEVEQCRWDAVMDCISGRKVYR